MAMILPPGQAADEVSHAIRVDALSRGILLGRRQGRDGGFVSTSTFVDLGRLTAEGAAQTKAEYEAAEKTGWSRELRFSEIGTIATYFPAVYAPAAIAVAAARAVDATPAQAFIAAREVNLLVFAALGALALGLTRRGQALIAGVLLLPMSVGLAASLSGDGVLIGSGALAVACLTRDGLRSWTAAAVLTTLISLTKLPYAPLLITLWPAASPRRSTRLAVIAAAVCVCAGWALFNQAQVMGSLARPPYQAGPLWPGPPQTFDSIDPAAQLQVLEADPARAVTLVVHTLLNETLLVRQTIGVLGWLTIYLPSWLYASWQAVLVLVVLALPWEPGRQVIPSLVALSALVLTAGTIMLAQYFNWTLVGAETISGVQGRYFLPALPFLALAVPCVRPVALPSLVGLPLALAFLDVAVVPTAVALASYLR